MNICRNDEYMQGETKKYLFTNDNTRDIIYLKIERYPLWEGGI